MAKGRLRRAVDRSITAAKSNGRIDLELNAAPIAMLRYMADFLDSDTGKTPATRYVTPASFLNYCDALGLVHDEKPKEEKPKARVVTVAGNSKWKQRASNG